MAEKEILQNNNFKTVFSSKKHGFVETLGLDTETIPLFEMSNCFCMENYQYFGILEKGKKFSRDPLVYCSIFYQEKLTATIAALARNHQMEKLPLEETFNIKCPKESLEIGRFSVALDLENNLKKILLKQVCHGIFIFYKAFQNKTGFDGELYIETFDLIKDLFEKNVNSNLFTLQEAEIVLENIPKESAVFYREMLPHVYKINKQILQEGL